MVGDIEPFDPDGTLMIDATLKSDLPPLALPAEEYMVRAREIWQELGLPRIVPQAPRVPSRTRGVTRIFARCWTS